MIFVGTNLFSIPEQFHAQRNRISVRRPPVLASKCKSFLILSTDIKLFRDVLACFRHRVGAKYFSHSRVNEPPADRRVENFCITAECRLRLVQDKRSPRHTFNAAGNGLIPLSKRNSGRKKRLTLRTSGTMNHFGAHQCANRTQNHA